MVKPEVHLKPRGRMPKRTKRGITIKSLTMAKGKGGKPSTTGKPSGGGRDNNPPKPKS